MRYLCLLVFVWAFGLTAPVSAEICCPSGCVVDVDRCVTTGTNPKICGSVVCSSTSTNSPGGQQPGGTGRRYSVPIGTPPGETIPVCYASYPDSGSRDTATDDCVKQLIGGAGVLACIFEDDAGRAEDRRTGLSCLDRQTALAKQCRARCANFAKLKDTCRSHDEVWEQSFGDINGFIYGFARVDLCGPRLKRRFDIQERAQPIPPVKRKIEIRTERIPGIRRP